MQITTVLVSHNPKSIQGRNGPFTIHEFTDSQGLEFSTTKTPIANQLYGLIGQPVGLEYDEKQNGSFTNRHITKVLGAGGPTSAPAAAPTAPATAPAGQAPQAPAAQLPLFSQDEKQILIMYQSFANNAALALLKQPEGPDVITIEALGAATKALINDAVKFAKQSVAAVTAGGASSPGTGGGDAGAGSESAPAQTDDGIPF